MVDTDTQKIENLLTRGVVEIFKKESLSEKLYSGKQLRIKFGIDPTGPKIHIGRAIVLRKLREFQDLGHTIILIIGDFTAQIGDASDKLSKRPMLTSEQIQENLKNYKEQIGKILDLSKVEFRYNSEWLATLTFKEICILAESFTVQQMIHRRNFAERIEKGEEISLREFMYPLMQGYDSVAIRADVELGGFDQLFNLKAGRIIQHDYDQTEQDVLITEMLEGLDGRKMSTSWGNIVTIVDEPEDMYGKILSLSDDLIIKYFKLCTNVSLSEIAEFQKTLTQPDTNPKILKMRLAREIVTLYHNEEKAQNAEATWISKFEKKEIPENMPEYTLVENLLETVLGNGLLGSKGEYRRVLEQNGIHNLTTSETITDIAYIPERGTIIKIGKQKFFKII